MIRILLLLAVLWSGWVQGFEPVTTELAEQQAFTGEGVVFRVTLRATGPFDAKAVFDLPQIPETSILSQGRPLISSETEGRGESAITVFSQRYSFVLYSQQSGSLTIPPIGVRFRAREGLQGEVQEHEEQTEPLIVQLEAIDPKAQFTASDYQIRQTWSIDPTENAVKAGDVIERTIQQQASATSAMFLPEFKRIPLDGVRNYQSSPVISDKAERGSVTARREDVLQYQFELGGEYRLPVLNVYWWDVDARKLQSAQLDGMVVTVEAEAVVSSQNRIQVKLVIVMLAVVVAGLYLRKWSRKRKRRVPSIRQQLISACQSDDAATAYQLGLRWQNQKQLPVDPWGRLWQDLARSLYSETSVPWKGQAMADFIHRFQEPSAEAEDDLLPPLN